MVVEPGRLVLRDARRQDLGLPRAGGRFEAFELADHGGDGVGPFHARLGGHGSRRSHHSSASAPGVKRPRKAKPSTSSAVSAAAMSGGASPSGAASAA